MRKASISCYISVRDPNSFLVLDEAFPEITVDLVREQWSCLARNV